MSPPEGVMVVPPRQFTDHIIAVVEGLSQRMRGGMDMCNCIEQSCSGIERISVGFRE
jgi:hypothetical protein